MKFSTKARYAVRLMIDIAEHSVDTQPVQIKEISARQGISERYLGQLVISLKNKGLIRGISGKSGGYLLAKQPANIRISDIIETMIGQINVVDCVRNPDACDKTGFCEMRKIYSLVNDRILETLAGFTLAAVVESRKNAPPHTDSCTGCEKCSVRDLCSTSF